MDYLIHYGIKEMITKFIFTVNEFTSVQWDTLTLDMVINYLQ